MALRRSTRSLTNLLLFGSAFVMSFFLLNTLLVHTKLGGGIWLGELILDEIRIRFLPLNWGGDCKINQTHLQRSCEGISHGYNQWIPGYVVSINPAGFRDRAYPLEKTADTYRILVLGDSFTFGEGVNNNETYTEVLELLLNQHSRITLFEVLNLGIGGAGTDSEYLILQRYSTYSPELVILQTLHNDDSDCIRDAPLIREPGMESLERCHCMRYYLKKIQDLAANLSAPLVVYDVSHPADCSLSLEPGSFYVAGGSFLDERRYHLGRKDTHPNREGHRLMALDLLPVILNITASQVVE